MDSNPEKKKIEIGEETLKHLNTLRKWTMFLAVSGFIFLGIIIALGLITGTFLQAFNHSDKTLGLSDALVLAGFIGLALLTFFPVFFLFRFSKHTSNALTTPDRKNMHKAIKSLKRFFIYIGILLIVSLAIYIFSLILAGRSAASLLGL
jgi:hypothetical protein